MKNLNIFVLFDFIYGVCALDFAYEMDIVINENTIQTFVGVSLDECWKECTSRSSCLSINFRPVANVCFLKNANKSNGIIEQQVGYVYREKLITEPVQCGLNTCKEGETCNRMTNGCEIRECSPLLETPAVTVLGNVWSVGSKAILKCQRGYVPSEGNTFSVTTVCGENGVWSKQLLCVPGCPDGWLQYLQTGSCYYFDEKAVTFQIAKELCAGLEGFVVHIDNAAEDAFLKTYMLDTFKNETTYSRNTFWLGLMKNSAGVWTWVDDESEAQFLSWHPIEPSNSEGKENCVVSLGEVEYVYKYLWSDQDCSRLCRAACEKKLI